jgi:hypothetical protein
MIAPLRFWKPHDMAENTLKNRHFRHSAQLSSQKAAIAVREMPYFAADSRTAACSAARPAYHRAK